MRSEIGVSSKIFQVVGVDLGLNLQNQNRPFLCNQDDGFITSRRSASNDVADCDGEVGPTCYGYSSCGSMFSDIYDVSAYSCSASLRVLQPFHVSFHPEQHPFFKPSGGMATAAMGFPFTVAQWKELERQAMIYKYMVASLPVPPDLLYSSFPTTLSPPPTTFTPTSYLLGKYGNGLNLNWSGNSKDAEPGRCRRTDGKKWRCSRDVAPNHKYCERHLHRGRPRSRKHVELLPNSLSDFPIIKNNNKNPNKKTRLDSLNPQPAVGSSLPLIPDSKVSTFDHPVCSGTNPFEDSRSMAWSEEQQWQQLVQANMNSLGFQHQFEGVPLNLNSQSDFSSKSEMGLFERPLIDAWSMGLARSKENGRNSKSSMVPSKGIHDNALDEDMCQIHMGLGVIDSWVASHSSPGGPLAEVLRPGPLTVVSRPSSNQTASESDLVSPPATVVSSPSGVLLKTFASLSDSSGNNSPTCHNSKANSDMPFHWLN